MVFQKIGFQRKSLPAIHLSDIRFIGLALFIGYEKGGGTLVPINRFSMPGQRWILSVIRMMCDAGTVGRRCVLNSVFDTHCPDL